MRGLLTTLVILVFAVGAFAADSPIDKGSMMVGGSLYYMNQGGDAYEIGGEAQSTFMLEPSFGYFIAPSIMIGANIEMMSYSVGDHKDNDFYFGPMVGYFFNVGQTRTEAKGGMYPYVIGFFMMGSSKTENGETYKENLTAFGGKAGINYMLTNSVALDIKIQFSSDSWKQKEPEEFDAISGTTMMIGAGISAFVF